MPAATVETRVVLDDDELEHRIKVEPCSTDPAGWHVYATGFVRATDTDLLRFAELIRVTVERRRAATG